MDRLGVRECAQSPGQVFPHSDNNSVVIWKNWLGLRNIYLYTWQDQKICLLTFKMKTKQTNKMLAARRKPGENAAFLKLSISQMLMDSASSEPLRTLRQMLDPPFLCSASQAQPERSQKNEKFKITIKLPSLFVIKEQASLIHGRAK